MDPDKTWENIVGLAQGLLEDDALVRGPNAEDALELAESVEVLRGWLASGGFPPKPFTVWLQKNAK